MTSPVDFGHTALPYGVYRTENGSRHVCIGLGTDLIDLAAAAGSLDEAVDPAILRTGRLNELLAAGSPSWSALRQVLVDLTGRGALDEFRRPQAGAELVLAWEVADFADFYSSLHHAENVGRMFRPDADPLLPNWRHLPVGYHGRAGTVYVDGSPVPRPAGQRQDPDGRIAFGPSTKLDIEAELGWVVGGTTAPGEPVPVRSAADHLFGLVLLNDWSARDIQAWEYVPLGPFLGKSFATSVSAWVMPLPALETARVPGPDQDPPPVEYLRANRPWAFDIEVKVSLTPAGGEPVEVARIDAAEALYWNAAQQLAHLTINGATVRPGDLFGTGTLSGPERSQRGSLLELSWNGTEPIHLGNGLTRAFLADGDEVTLSATFPGPGDRIPLGPVSGRVV